MKQKIAYLTLLVHDYDEALEFYTKKLHFELIEDTDVGGGKRWVLVAPPGGANCLLLAKVTSPQQAHCVGNQAGGRVFIFLQTDDFWRDYHDMQARGVKFTEQPRTETYGTVVVFEDLYGNKWDLLALKTPLT